MTAKIARYVQEHEATLAELKIARDRLIRAAHSRGGVSYGELAREYGITRQRAHQIVHGASRERPSGREWAAELIARAERGERVSPAALRAARAVAGESSHAA